MSRRRTTAICLRLLDSNLNEYRLQCWNVTMKSLLTMFSLSMLLAASARLANGTNLARISVASPEYCSEVKGATTITVLAPGFDEVTVKCWKQGPGFGADSVVA